MKIATFNVNGVNGPLPILRDWLTHAKSGPVCLQELNARQKKAPGAAIREAGYGAIRHGQKSWNGVAILMRGATHSRYIEASVDDIMVGCTYLPNGNPAPGVKFDYKLALCGISEAALA